MYSPPQLLTLIEARLIELGMTQAQLGQKAFGKADNTAIQSLKKGSSPAIDRLEAMASALGWEIYFGPPRRRVDGMSEPPSESGLLSVQATSRGYSPLPWLDPFSNKGSAPVAFLDEWISANGLILDNLAATTSAAIYLEGFDPNKTLAVIDKTAPRRGFGLWCLKEPTGITLAQTLFDKDDLVIETTGQSVPPRLVRNWRSGMTVPAGKVVWLGTLPQP